MFDFNFHLVALLYYHELKWNNELFVRRNEIRGNGHKLLVPVSIVESICRSLHPKNPISPDKVHNYRIYLRCPLKFVSGWNTEMQKKYFEALNHQNWKERTEVFQFDMRVKLLTEISAMFAGFWMDTYNGAESRLQIYYLLYVYCVTYFLHFSLFIIYFLSIAPSVGVFNYNYNYNYNMCIYPPIIHQCSRIAVDRWAKGTIFHNYHIISLPSEMYKVALHAYTNCIAVLWY